MDSKGGILTKGLSCGPACETLIVGFFNLQWRCKVVPIPPATTGGSIPLSPGELGNMVIPSKLSEKYAVYIKVNIKNFECEKRYMVNKYTAGMFVKISDLKMKYSRKLNIVMSGLKRIKRRVVVKFINKNDN